MKQFIIYLTNGTHEKSVIISSNKKRTVKQFKFIRDNFPKESAWYELREYHDVATDKYAVLNV